MAETGMLTTGRKAKPDPAAQVLKERKAEQERLAKAEERARAMLGELRGEQERVAEATTAEQTEREQRLKRVQALAKERGLTINQHGQWDAYSLSRSGARGTNIHHEIRRGLSLAEAERYLTETEPPTKFEAMRMREALSLLERGVNVVRPKADGAGKTEIP